MPAANRTWNEVGASGLQAKAVEILSRLDPRGREPRGRASRAPSL